MRQDLKPAPLCEEGQCGDVALNQALEGVRRHEVDDESEDVDPSPIFVLLRLLSNSEDAVQDRAALVVLEVLFFQTDNK